MTHTPAAKAFTDLILTIFRLDSEIVAAGNVMTKDLGLSSSRWQICGQIFHSGETLSVSQIARNMGLQRQPVQLQVDAMAKDGLVTFADNPRHQRAKLVRMTTAGRKAYRAALRRQVGWANRTARGISATALSGANATLRQLLEHMQTRS